MSVDKPKIKAYKNKSAEKQIKSKRVHNLPPRHETKAAANKENLRSENMSKRILSDGDDKLNSKIFKLIEESLLLIESNQNYNS